MKSLSGGAKDTLLAEVKLPPLGFSGFCLQQVEGTSVGGGAPYPEGSFFEEVVRRISRF